MNPNLYDVLTMCPPGEMWDYVKNIPNEPSKCNQWKHFHRMSSEHLKCSLPLPTGHIVGKMHMSSKCTQHVITGFQAPLPPVTAIPRHKMESPCDSMSDASPSPIHPLCEGDGGLHICPQSFTLFFRVFPCLFPFSMYFLHFDAFSSFRRVLFISTHSLHLQRVLFIFDALSSFLICSPHLHYPQATS